MASKTGKLYVNTFVFTLIAGIISLMLLLLLVFGSPTIAEFAYLIITVEIGLILIIALAIWRLHTYTTQVKKYAQLGVMNQVAITGCPDYWTLEDNNGKPRCKNTYTAPHDPAVSYSMKGASASMDISSFQGLTIDEACKKVKDLPNTAWTDITTACDAFNQ